jgi:hypothetical protein
MDSCFPFFTAVPILHPVEPFPLKWSVFATAITKIMYAELPAHLVLSVTCPAVHSNTKTVNFQYTTTHFRAKQHYIPLAAYRSSCLNVSHDRWQQTQQVKPRFTLQGKACYFFCKASQPSLGPTQCPIQWAPGALPLRQSGRDVKRATHPDLVVRSIWSGSISPLLHKPPYRAQRQKFTFTLLLASLPHQQFRLARAVSKNVSSLTPAIPTFYCISAKSPTACVCMYIRVYVRVNIFKLRQKSREWKIIFLLISLNLNRLLLVRAYTHYIQ